jgi:hypothetical protein
MLKTLLLVVAGLVVGLALAYWLQPSSEPAVAAAPLGDGSTPAVGVQRADERIADLEDALDAEILQRSALEDRVAELAAQLEALGQRPRFARGADAAAGGPPGDSADVGEIRAREEAVRRVFEREQRLRGRSMSERLTDAGFAPDRAEWINRRTEELRMKTLQEQYDARREGRAPVGDSPDTTLRADLGEADYERYRTALGQPTSVGVADVLASSPAERAGLMPGDEIVAYAGKRVYDVGELNALTLEGTSGESVVVDVRRDGQNVQLVMPRGPIGVTGGFRGPPGGFPR